MDAEEKVEAILQITDIYDRQQLSTMSQHEIDERFVWFTRGEHDEYQRIPQQPERV